MSKTQVINVKGVDVAVKRVNEGDYLSLTDMLKAKEGEFFVKTWLRNRNTIEFIGIWESVHNPNFNWYEFDLIRKDAGLNRFNISVKEWIERTNAIGFKADAGRYGGTYAHQDIAFEFGMWISPEFKIYLIKEYQRLKKAETQQIAWTARRELARVNFHIHTEAIKENLIVPSLTQSQKTFKYASETDMLNVALFGITASEWRDNNKNKDGNMRDYATDHQLSVLANMESMNSELIKQKIDMEKRMEILNKMAKEQLEVLYKVDAKLALTRA